MSVSVAFAFFFFNRISFFILFLSAWHRIFFPPIDSVFS